MRSSSRTRRGSSSRHGAWSWTRIWRPEGFTRLTWEIEEGKSGVTKLTVIHDLEGELKLAALLAGAMEDVGAGGGWSWVLSDLKMLLETGKPLDTDDLMS